MPMPSACDSKHLSLVIFVNAIVLVCEVMSFYNALTEMGVVSIVS